MEEKLDSGEEDFYDALDKAYVKWPRHDIKVVIRDFSAKVGRDCAYEPDVGIENLHEESNDNYHFNGLWLVDFAIFRNMVIGGILHPHEKIHKGTSKSPNQLTVNQVDHVVLEARHRSSLLEVRIYREANVDSDHYLLSSKILSRIANSKKDHGK
jgi:hypothetical protein